MGENTEMTKKCAFCGRELTLDHFNKSKKAKDGHQSHCRECQSLLNKERNARLKKEQENHPKREVSAEAKKSLSEYTPMEIFTYLASIGYRWHEKAIWHEEVIVKREFVVPSVSIK